MILKDSPSCFFKTFHLSVDQKGDESDWIEIDDFDENVSIKIHNGCVGEKEFRYYYLEIDKNSDLWKNFVNVIKEIS